MCTKQFLFLNHSENMEAKSNATYTVHWPTGPHNACEAHALGLVSLAKMLGSHAALTKLEGEAVCKNCENEVNDRYSEKPRKKA